MTNKKTEKRLWLLPNYIGIKHPDAWLPKYYLEKIKNIDLIFCESYKRAEMLLDRQDLGHIELFEVNEHTKWNKTIYDIENHLFNHQEIGILSDAGMPCIADPGEKIVSIAHEIGYSIKTLPGPNSMVMALAASGLNAEKFSFKGYLSIDKQDRNKELSKMVNRIKEENETQIFMETPYRNFALLENLLNKVPDSFQLSISKDLLGRDEETLSKPIKEWKQKENAKTWMHKTPAVFVLGKNLN